MTTLPPTLTTQFVNRDLPTLTLPKTTASSSSSSSFTTPSITVPPNADNPYILRSSDLSGTVFIALGSIVGVILIGFILYHLINSMIASRQARKAFSNDKQVYEKYNNNINYGLTPSTTLNNYETNNNSSTLFKLPLLSHHNKTKLDDTNISGSQLGDTSTIYQSEMHSTQDLTKMFISPTAEAMHQKRIKSQVFDNNFNGSIASFSTTSNSRTMIPNLYVNQDANSDYALNGKKPAIPGVSLHLHLLATNSTTDSSLNIKSSTRKTIPSMYLEDLIDE